MSNRAEQEFILAGMDLLLRGLTARTYDPGEAPYISVVIPVFNREWFVGNALESLGRQTWQSYEVIVVDDASTDGTAGVLKDWAGQDKRIHVVTNDRRLGSAVASNRALSVSKGEIIVHLDSDNLLYRNALETIAETFKGSLTIWSIYTAHLWSHGVGSLGVRCPEPSLTDLMAMRETFDLNAFAYRRTLYEAMGGFDERLTRLSDWELTIRYGKAVTARRIPIPTGHYRHGDWARNSNRVSFGWNRHVVSATHAVRIAAAMKVLYLMGEDVPAPNSSLVAEWRFMISRGVIIEAWFSQDPSLDTTLSELPVKLHRGELADAIAAARPDVLHLNSPALVDRHHDDLAAFPRPVTIRGFAGDRSGDLLAGALRLKTVRSIYTLPAIYTSSDGAAQLPSRSERVIAVPITFDPALHFPSPEKDRRLVVRSCIAQPAEDPGSFLAIAARCPRHRFVLCLHRSTDQGEFLDQIVAENQKLGDPVEIRLNPPLAEVAQLLRSAGIYLHSYSSDGPFGMPVPLAEAMATGAYVISRTSEAGEAYLGSAEQLWATTEQAAALINATLNWDDTAWTDRSRQAIDQAFVHFSPDISMRVILDDWRHLTQGQDLLPRDCSTIVEVQADEALTFGWGSKGVDTLRVGFHPAEEWGVWTGQANTTLVFATVSDGWTEIRGLSLVAHALCEAGAALSTCVLVNGHSVGEWQIGPDHDHYRLDLGEIALRPGMVVNIAFETAPLRAPSDDDGADRRWLGIAVKQLSFHTAVLPPQDHGATSADQSPT